MRSFAGYSSDTFSEFQATLDSKGNTLGKLNIPQEGTANFEIIVPWLLRNVLAIYTYLLSLIIVLLIIISLALISIHND